MASITSLTDPLIRRIIEHVFNKHRADVVGKDGKLMASKKKFRQTSNQLAAQYGLKVQHSFLKSKQAALLQACEDAQWCVTDEGYNSDAAVSQVQTKYLGANPTLRAAAASPARAGPASLSDSRYMALIHGELANISRDLRTIAGVVAAGTSKGKFRTSLHALLNTEAGEDEEDDEEDIVKSKGGRAKRQASDDAAAPAAKKSRGTSAAAAAAASSSSSSSDDDDDDEQEEEEEAEQKKEEGIAELNREINEKKKSDAGKKAKPAAQAKPKKK